MRDAELNSDITAPGAPLESTEGVNILIVDDEPKNLTVLETVLDDPTYRLIRASSPEEALLALVANDFALLVLDVQMPGMTGFELASMIKQRKRTALVPIIFLTAYYNEDQDVLEGYGSGAVDYLHKPVNAAVLRSKVAVFAELHRRDRALAAANRKLTAEIAERSRAQMSLSELNDTLESRVAERTQALHASEALLRDADRRKDEFLATLAHELRNPLAPMRTAIKVLQLKGLATPELQRAAALIDRQVRAMSRLIDDLMDVSRISRGKFELQTERLELAAVLNAAIESSRPLIDEFSHDLQLRLPRQPVWIDADALRLTQAFMNLLNNATKYTDRGGRLAVDVTVGDGEVVISVSDNGIGIPADKIDRVFEMFSQIDTALARSRGGLGIGLSLTRRLVEMHGGHVVGRSDGPGRGSRFEVTLPLAKAPVVSPATAMVDAAVEPSSAAAAAPRARLSVLIADDNRDAAEALGWLLKDMGYRVSLVHDGLAAVQAAAELHPDVVVLDIGMPGLDGYETCRRIRALPGGEAMGLLAVTGWGQPEDRRKAQEAGFDQHLVKPVDPETWSRLLDGRQLRHLPIDGVDLDHNPGDGRRRAGMG